MGLWYVQVVTQAAAKPFVLLPDDFDESEAQEEVEGIAMLYLQASDPPFPLLRLPAVPVLP